MPLGHREPPNLASRTSITAAIPAVVKSGKTCYDGNGRSGPQSFQNQIGYEATSDDDGAGGWVVWIGVLILVNLLSWMFDWSFWIY